VKLRRVESFAHAKVNIGWRVGARREDGYHDVNGLIQTISLADRLEFVADDGDGVRVSVPGHPGLEASNLVLDAARLLERFVRPTKITIDKQIPVAAGLGGGSADAAAALCALNVLWGAELPAQRLVQMGAEIGSDVPALLLGGLVHVSGRGEHVRRIGSTSGYGFVLGISEVGVSAADAYRMFDELPPGEPNRLEHNDLEAAACALVPGLAERVEAMRAACGVAFVSGSGPTVVGVSSDAETAADAVRNDFDRVEVTGPNDSGVVLRLTR
jgi:4-diphosphocytidyl-2-C-methyl-D-erythritol kinase